MQNSPREVGFWRAALTAAGLSLLFLLVYGSTNWWSSQRSDVGTLYFEWERHIPFIPLMIVPYMSIDLFFIGAPFLCRTRRELSVFSKRVILGVLVAGTCFLLFPLRFAFERPQADGWLGAVFDWFRQMDQPYNLLPSLHITLRTLLTAVYVKHSRGFLRMLAHVWFSLIGFSTIFTYQHHVLDVVGGFALAGYCFYLFPDSPGARVVSPNRKIGAYYVCGAMVLATLAAVFWGWAVLLLWPAVSLVLIGRAYFEDGAAVYRKTNGRLPVSSMWAIAPALLGQHLSLLHYRRQCDAWNHVTSNVWIGRKLNDAEAQDAARSGVTAVLDLTGEFSEAAPFLALQYRNIPVLDLTAPTPAQIEEAVAFISEQSAKGIVYVHCKIGYSRSAAVVAAWLIASGHVPDAEAAMALLRRTRPSIVIRPEIRECITGSIRINIPDNRAKLQQNILS